MATATQSALAQKMNERSSTSSHFENALRQKIAPSAIAVMSSVLGSAILFDGQRAE
jgi:hypothetical protein